MGKKSVSSAPAVDSSVGTALQKMADTNENYNNWYQNTMYPWLVEQTNTSNEQNNRYMDALEQNSSYWQNYATTQAERSNAITDALWDRYQNYYMPVENELIEDASNYNTAAEAERQAGLAIADTQTAYTAQRQALQQQMAQYGVDPSSGRYVGQANALNVNQAAAKAMAANQARSAAEELGWTKKYQVAALGSNYLNSANTAATTAASSASSAANTSTSSLTSAASLNNTNLSNVSNLANIGLSSYSALSNGWGSYGNLGLGTSNYNLNAWNAQQQANQASTNGIMSMVGTGVGVAAAF